MRHSILGGLIGVLIGAVVLVACGGSSTVPAGVSQAELDPQLAALRAQLDTIAFDLTTHEARLTAHEAAQTAPVSATPVLGLNYVISTLGSFPSRNLTAGVIADDPNTALSDDPVLGGISLFAGNFAPRGWIFCHGQLLDIATNTALFALLGTNFGGDGRTTFGVPDLRARVAMGENGSTLRLGERQN